MKLDNLILLVHPVYDDIAGDELTCVAWRASIVGSKTESVADTMVDALEALVHKLKAAQSPLVVVS